jgi:L-threonylcarbamoyladenylate synthase
VNNAKTLELNIDEELESSLKLAHVIYYGGGIFVYPTDTIYGFGANPFNKDAVDEISRIKQRDEAKRYILLVQDIKSLLKYVQVVDDLHIDFLMNIWPNPVSVVLPARNEVADILETETLAFRIPAHNFCQHVLERIQAPLVSTSVNRSGEPPLNDAISIMQEFRDEVHAVFYSQKAQLPVSSTVIDLTAAEPALIREGRIPFSYIMKEYVSAMEKYAGRNRR